MTPKDALGATRDLNHACYHGFPDEALAALCDGADPLARGASGKLALHYAAMGGHAWICSHLASLHPEAARARDAAGQTPLHLACRNGRREAALALHAQGAALDERDDFGRLPHECCPDAETREALLRAESLRRAAEWANAALAAALGRSQGLP